METLTPNPVIHPPTTKNSAEKTNTYLWIAVLGFTLWGLFPIYFKLFKEVSPWEVVAVRICATFVFLFLFLFATGQSKKIFKYLQDTRSARYIGFATVFLFINWISYAIAIISGQVLSASLGYFISPIFTVMIGILFLHERISSLKVIAVVLCIVAVIAKGVYEESLSIYSLLIGGSFSIYGVYKKHILIPVASTLFLEMGILLLPALGFIVYQISYGELAFLHALNELSPLAFAFPGLGLITILPALLFAFAVRQVDLSIMGFLQYLTPLIVFLLAVFVYQEKMERVNTVMFIMIWIAIMLVSFEQYQYMRHARLKRSKSKK